jgi:lipoprotein NlpI
VAKAVSASPRHELLLKCEAYFYVGQEYLIRNQKDKAQAAFDLALATGATEFLEYDWSARELELLGANR